MGNFFENIKDNREVFIIFAVAGIGYGGIEVLFRGFTHWSMLLTAGGAVVSIYYLNRNFARMSLLGKAFMGSTVITTYELAVGLIVNKWFHLDVWDYTLQRYDLWGQICPLFSIFWFFISYILASLQFFFYNRQRDGSGNRFGNPVEY